jgi:carbon monoxide dehydrogenase subunit G
MEKLHNEFTVRRDIRTAFEVLTDLEALAPCLPGATLESREGDNFIGSVKVKLGAIAANFGGTVHIVEKNETDHTVSLLAKGREKSGRGMAEAAIAARLEEVSADETRVIVDTELKIMGKIAQFGRGIINDVSKQLIDQFAANVDRLMSSPTTPGHEAAAVPKEENVLELGSVLSGVLLKRFVPVAIAVAAVIVIAVLVF